MCGWSGGFGGFLVQALEWTSREKVLRSYELLARYVIPQFQGALAGTTASSQMAQDRSQEHRAMRLGAIEGARQTWAKREN